MRNILGAETHEVASTGVGSVFVVGPCADTAVDFAHKVAVLAEALVVGVIFTRGQVKPAVDAFREYIRRIRLWRIRRRHWDTARRGQTGAGTRVI